MEKEDGYSRYRRWALLGLLFILGVIVIVPDLYRYTQKADIPDFEMVRVPSGTFTMGCQSKARDGDCDDDEKPAHPVTLSTFYISAYEVTQAQWEAVMGNNPSYFKGCPNCPVENVSWDDIREFLKNLNAETGESYRLPTEAEWEYAARGGNAGAKDELLYSGSDDIDAVAWYNGNSDSRTHEVGQKQPNQLGLYDMSGNVWEWCSDWYGKYSSDDQRNPKGPHSGSFRVLRGGGWRNSSKYCRAALRNTWPSSTRNNNLGFRLARSS